jgi:hypothetical protein
MTTAQLDHLRAIVAHLDRLLAIAAKRTPGEWAGDWNRIRDSQCATVCFANSFDPNTDDTWIADKEYIAACARNAEAGWRSTKGAIGWLLRVYDRCDEPTSEYAKEALEGIIAEWPIETLKP